MTTLRKLPMIAPNVKEAAKRSVDIRGGIVCWRCPTADARCPKNFGNRTSGIGHRPQCYPALLLLEANGVWWPPRSSKPLFRRGSVEGFVRFRHASANLFQHRGDVAFRALRVDIELGRDRVGDALDVVAARQQFADARGGLVERVVRVAVEQRGLSFRARKPLHD